jgi:hypothetical protein
MIVVIIRFDYCRSKFCQVARKFDDHWFIVRVFNASFNWRMTIDFRISFIALRITMNRWMIVNVETFISIMQKYASKISNVNIKSSKSIELFNAYKIICKVDFESISNIFATMIAYSRRRNSWYRLIISIEW